MAGNIIIYHIMTSVGLQRSRKSAGISGLGCKVFQEALECTSVPAEAVEAHLRVAVFGLVIAFRVGITTSLYLAVLSSCAFMFSN